MTAGFLQRVFESIFMIMHCFKSVFFVSLLLALVACNQADYSALLLGTWEGGEREGETKWCITYYEGGAFQFATQSLEIVMETEGEEKRSRLEPKLELYEGDYLLGPGGRLENNIVPLGMAGVKDESGQLPLARKERYIIKSIDEKEMHYRDEFNNERWFFNERVDSCSEQFMPGLPASQ